MSIRVILALIGIGIATVCVAFLKCTQPSLVVHAYIAVGVSTAFIVFGLEHLRREPPILDNFADGSLKNTIGWMFIAIGLVL